MGRPRLAQRVYKGRSGHRDESGFHHRGRDRLRGVRSQTGAPESFLLYLFPPGSALPTNGRLIVEAVGDSIDLLERVRLGHSELVGTSERIALRVEAFQGEDAGPIPSALLMLVPTRPLAANTRYRLELDPPYPAWGDGRDIAVGAGPDHTALRWKGSPKVMRLRQAGIDGPEIDVLWAWLPVERNGLLAFRVDIEGGAKRWSYLEPVNANEDGFDTVHVELAGPGSKLSSGVQYVARFKAIDTGGNESTAPASLTFTPP